MTKTYWLADTAAPSHESAEDMYDSLGNLWNWHDYDSGDSGQVVHPIADVSDLDSKTDEQIIAECEPSCAAERGAYESALAYAREALDDMRSIESALDAAIDAWERGDLEAVIEHLDVAEYEEGHYGDCPATRALADQLLEEDEIVTIEEMPDYLRESHRTAGNWGFFPHNGATRREVSRSEADEIIDADPDGYAHIVE